MLEHLVPREHCPVRLQNLQNEALVEGVENGCYRVKPDLILTLARAPIFLTVGAMKPTVMTQLNQVRTISLQPCFPTMVKCTFLNREPK